MKDLDLIQKAQQGNKHAFQQLIKAYVPTIERFAYQIGNRADEVDDVVQEVFIRLYRFLDTVNQDTFSTWLYKVTLNVTRDLKRKEKRYEEKVKKIQSEPASWSYEAEDTLLKDELAQHMHEVLQKLDEKFKVPLVLYYFQELTYKEISDVLNLRISTVKTRIMRAKQKLKDLMLAQKERLYDVGQ